MNILDRLRKETDAYERTRTWRCTPDDRLYGPGLTREEVEGIHNKFLRSGSASTPSGYHNQETFDIGPG